MIDIAKLCQESHEYAKKNGFLDEPRLFDGDMCLFHEELSEALGDYRSHRGLDEIYYEVTLEDGTTTTTTRTDSIANIEKHHGSKAKKAKPCGIPIELADYVIRIAQYCGSGGIDLARGLDGWAVSKFEEDQLNHFERFLNLAHKLTAMVEPGVGIASRLGACVDLVFTYCRVNKIDIEAAIKEKAAYNLTREYRHGGRKI